VVFDLEGVLIDNSRRLRYALGIVGARSVEELSYPRKSRFWKIFLDENLARRMDTVNIRGLMILADRSLAYKIVVVSGAPERIVKEHLKKIKEEAERRGISIRIDRVFFRRRTREKAPDFKERILKLLMTKDEIVEVHDDDERVLQRVKKYGIRCILWKNLRPISWWPPF